MAYRSLSALGELMRGHYAVGFCVIYAFDHTRTWRVTHAYEKGFAPDSDGGPVRGQRLVSRHRSARSAASELRELPLLLRQRNSPISRRHWRSVTEQPPDSACLLIKFRCCSRPERREQSRRCVRSRGPAGPGTRRVSESALTDRR